MHIMLISACEKRALKKTRAILDSYAPRVGERTWSAPMTQEGLKELHQAMRRVATRQTAVACYINHGRRSMKLLWTVGAKHRFDEQGRYPVASTRANQLRPVIPDWVRASSLLAGAAGDMHDIGKASQRFQNKLKPDHQGISADPVRHEWLSMKLLQRLRHNGWNWGEAWQNIDHKIKELTLGDRTLVNNANGLESAQEAVDYLVVTHHALLSAGDRNAKDQGVVGPNANGHVRQIEDPERLQYQCAGDLPDSIFQSHQHRMRRLDSKFAARCADLATVTSTSTSSVADHDYWKALALHSRAALIFADHTVSAQSYAAPDAARPPDALYANTKTHHDVRYRDQPLWWHLQQVGDRAARIAMQMHSDLALTGLSESTVESICKKSSGRFIWQNHAAQALSKQQQKHPDRPALIFNIAGTGSGKTRMNLRALCSLCPVQPRVAIALNLRSLTLQTGTALKNAMHLDSTELAVIVGDQTIIKLHEATQSKEILIDEDENSPEADFSVWGSEDVLPEWLKPLFQNQRQATSSSRAQTVLTSPLLVSTIDYLIAAGEPSRQGHHVKALLRIMSSDLILDEIDSYDPPSLMAVLRVVQLSALYGRRVICSSATLSLSVAKRIEQAFDSGLRMRQSLYQQPQTAIYGILDNQLAPDVWLNQVCDSASFVSRYQQHLKQLATALIDKPIHRLAELQQLAQEASIEDWQAGVLQACQRLHERHYWILKQSDPHNRSEQASKRVSIGLVRVAHVKTAVTLARYLAKHYPAARIACYHANDWLISRHCKEVHLDRLLSRQKGSTHLQTDPAIVAYAKQSIDEDVPFIVIATPVEEVGRDHCFDWGVIDISSCQSLVQTAGRINRHRLVEVTQPNIAIMQRNAAYCQMIDKNKRQAVFCYPGYEPYNKKEGNTLRATKRENFYGDQDLASLLPWDHASGHAQLVIDARLRFDGQYCRLAYYDDGGIEAFTQKYFSAFDDATITKAGYFSHQTAVSLGLSPYDKTPLRAYTKKQSFFFRYEDEVLGFFAKEFKQSRYGKLIPDDVRVNNNFKRYPLIDQAWLALSADDLIDQCEHYDLRVEDGCRIELRQYNSASESIDYGDWIYDESFGVVKASNS